MTTAFTDEMIVTVMFVCCISEGAWSGESGRRVCSDYCQKRLHECTVTPNAQRIAPSQNGLGFVIVTADVTLSSTTIVEVYSSLLLGPVDARGRRCPRQSLRSRSRIRPWQDEYENMRIMLNFLKHGPRVVPDPLTPRSLGGQRLSAEIFGLSEDDANHTNGVIHTFTTSSRTILHEHG